jgi:Flp pilus assembly pilin Flp
MVARVRRVFSCEEAQELVEYVILVAFICLAAAAMLINAGRSMSTIWKDTNTVLSHGGTQIGAAAR